MLRKRAQIQQSNTSLKVECLLNHLAQSPGGSTRAPWKTSHTLLRLIESREASWNPFHSPAFLDETNDDSRLLESNGTTPEAPDQRQFVEPVLSGAATHRIKRSLLRSDQEVWACFPDLGLSRTGGGTPSIGFENGVPPGLLFNRTQTPPLLRVDRSPHLNSLPPVASISRD
jgi:hypothetical protein